MVETLRGGVRLLCLFFALAAVGCGAQPAGTLPPAASPTSSPQLAATPSLTAPSRSGLAPGGPWLVFAARPKSEAGSLNEESLTLWAVNPDGSGLTQLSDEKLSTGNGSVPQFTVSPDGQWLATITSPDGWHDLALNLLSAKDLRLQAVTPLTSANTELPPDIADAGPDDPRFNVRDSLNDAEPTWSPDSCCFLFASAHESATADPYIYSLDSSRIVRISAQGQQVATFLWSSDGQTVVYGEMVSAGPHYQEEGTPTPAGIVEPGVWMVGADGSNERRLYEAPYSYGDVFMGWTQPDTFVVYQSIFNSGPGFLRTVNIRTETVRQLSVNLGGFALDPVSGTLVYADLGTLDKDFMLVGQGKFVLTRGASQPEPFISEFGNDEPFAQNAMLWLPERNIFVVQLGSKGTIAVTPDGKASQVAAPDGWTQMSVSRDGETAAWYGFFTGQAAVEGLWIGKFGVQPSAITTESIATGSWSPDNDSFFYVTNSGQLMRVSTSTAAAERLAPDLEVHWNKIVWLGGTDH